MRTAPVSSDEIQEEDQNFQYTSYRNLPPVAGIASFEEAGKPGLSVEESVSRLKRIHYALLRLTEIFVARIPAEPVYELKTAFSLHAHLCAEHVDAIRQRVGEMREPPLGLDKIPHPALEILFDEIIGAPDTPSLLLGIYKISLPAIRDALERYRQEANPLTDSPTLRLCRFALLEVDDMLAYGKRANASFPFSQASDGDAWQNLLTNCLAAAGGLDGSSPATEHADQRIYSKEPFKFDREPRRDGRFPDPFNKGVNAEAFLYDEEMPEDAKVLMMLFKRLREIDVPEMMASIITDTKGKPWEYYRDMIRQLWDEARHAIMGEVGFFNLRIPWPEYVMVNFTWARELNLQLTPIERHAVLYFIEQGLMSKTGKRYEWEVGRRSNFPFAATFQDFDWADEVLHSRIGRDWYVSQMASQKEAIEYGDRSWSSILGTWESWKEQGLTSHRNWWPGLYQAYCQISGTEPDPKVLAYSQNYKSSRDDLKEVGPSY